MKRAFYLKAETAWFVALLLLIPGIKTHWTFLSFGATLNPAALSAPAVSYALFGIGVLLAFVWWCRCRRLVFGAFLLVLCALHIFLKDLTLYRIFTFATYAVVIGILVEFVRQNMPLYRHLKASSARIIPMLRKALLLWSPALLFIGFGIYLNQLIVETTKDAVYEIPLIDEYCVISAEPDWPPIPCSEYGLDAPLGATDKIAIYVDGLYFFRLEGVLDDLSRREAEPDEQLYEELMARLDPISMFHLEEYFKTIQIEREQEAVHSHQKELRRGSRRDEKELRKALKRHEDKLEELLKIPVENLPPSEIAPRLVELAFGRALLSMAALADLRKMEDSKKNAAFRVWLKETTSVVRTQTREILKDATEQENESLIEIFDCPWLADGNAPVLQPVSVAESVQNSLDQWLGTRELELKVGSQQMQNKIGKATADIDEIKTHHMELWDGDKPFLPELLDLPDDTCHFPYVNCWLLNSLKKKARDSYAHTREALRDRAVERVNDTVDAAIEAGQPMSELIRDVRHQLDQDLEDAKGYIQTSVTNVVKGGAIASALLKLFLALAIIKSLFYVLATEVFHKQGVSFIGLEGETTAEGTYHLSASVEIPRDETTPLITATVGVNQGKETIIPQPVSGLVSRILRNRWLLNRGTHAGTASMRFTQPGGHMGIDWELQEGEEVVFNYRDLLGFSENVELRSTISLQLSSLLFGKHLFHIARCVGGPGRLLLSVSGQIEDHQDEVQSFPLERLIAWNRHTKFKVMDERTLGAVFKDGFTVGREGDGGAGSGLVLVGAPTKRPPLVDGTIRFVKTFLMPF